jgi:glucokinase
LILVGDIGGTNTRLALVEGDPRAPLALEIYPSGAHSSLEEIVRAFLAAHPATPAAASFAIAGPVRDGHVRVTNLAWSVDAASLAATLGLDRVVLLNDLEANARGLASLGPDDLHVLNAGRPDATGNAAVCSAGTGLGEAGLYWDGRRHHPFACEGGHTDFAPLTTQQEGLREFVAAQHGHVSYERVCSGPGLVTIYSFLGGESSLTAPEITQLALVGEEATAVAALDLFVEIYGAEAGNLALKLMATGGVYLGGGIAPRILPKLEEGSFMQTFTAKGRFADLLAAVPVRVIMNDRTTLMGAALAAEASLAGSA